MALGAVLAAALTDHSARAKALYVDNVDVVFTPTAGNGVGVPIDTVHVTEAGPGAVSSMEFTIDDPSLDISIGAGSAIRFHDITRDAPLFTGFVQAYSIRPAFGGQGRTIAVTAVGIEVLLDWGTLTESLSWNFFDLDAATIPEAVQQIVTASTGLGPIRTGVSAGQSNQAAPISSLYAAGLFNPEIVTLEAGTSVRAALAALWGALTVGSGELPPALEVTIDFYGGLRVWQSDDQPTDYTDLTINDAPVGPIIAENLDYSVDAASVVRGVWVTTSGEAVFVSDGTGLPGAIHYLVHEEWLGYPDVLASLGQAYLAEHASGVRGSYDLLDRTPVPTIHPGSQTVITDARIPLAAASFLIAQIEKDFNGSNRDDWHVSFGGAPPSATTLIRHLTRDTLN